MLRWQPGFHGTAAMGPNGAYVPDGARVVQPWEQDIEVLELKPCLGGGLVICLSFP